MLLPLFSLHHLHDLKQASNSPPLWATTKFTLKIGSPNFTPHSHIAITADTTSSAITAFSSATFVILRNLSCSFNNQHPEKPTRDQGIKIYLQWFFFVMAGPFYHPHNNCETRLFNVFRLSQYMIWPLFTQKCSNVHCV